MTEPPVVRYVTNKELKDEIDQVRAEIVKLPTRWEVRFLILAGIIASQVIPTAEIASAAIGWLP
jgi:hypothetical protein